MPKMLGNLNDVPKNLTSLEHPLRKKFPKFLGNLPSEQIFYRNIPLGAPENGSNIDTL